MQLQSRGVFTCAVLFCLVQAGLAIDLHHGDVFTGMFELGGLANDNYFVLRAHSPVQGAFTWFTGLGHAPGWMTHCTTTSNCAGGPLTRPIFGTLNVTGVGECTGEVGGCTGPPDIQPASGCFAYGCWHEACGCQVGDPQQTGCWGRDMRNTVALIQRGNKIGETQTIAGCTFSRKIHFAEMAGAIAAIVFNNEPYAAVFMSADEVYTNVSIPALFLTKEAGLLLWDMIKEAEMHGGVDVSLTNNTENSMRLTIDRVEGGEVTGDVEFRLEEMGIDAEDIEHLNISNNEMYPYGSFRVQGVYNAGVLSLRPMCHSLAGNAAWCSADQTVWNRKPLLLEHGLDKVLPFGLQLEVRAPGDDGIAFEHVRGYVVDNEGNHDPAAHVKLRWVPSCQPEISFVVDCMDKGGSEEGQQCLSALDERGYRNFNDQVNFGSAPLFWYCDTKYCAGDYLTKQALKRLEVQQVPPLPDPCPDGQKHGYVYLGPDSWDLDESLHLCGYGDRSRQPHVCRQLPTGWYFNTSCQIHADAQADEKECGHHGWFMEGGFISSCTDSADCAVDDSRSELDLHIDLQTQGQVAFTYTAHGEQFFDYMTFEVNDNTVHHTQSWWSTGSFISGVVVALPPGRHKLSWAWVKDWSLSGGDDKATLHEIFITGTPQDSSCTDCPAGFCGNGGLQGCVVCPRSMKSPSAGSTECQSCGSSPEGTIYTGPADWPHEGNAASCSWGCTKGFCSPQGSSEGTAKCSDSTSCEAGMCCPNRGECYMPTLEQVESGDWPITMEMLRNCVELTPFSSDAASKTGSILQEYLGEDGVYPWYNQKVPGSSNTKGELIKNVLYELAANSQSASYARIDELTHMPVNNDWHGMHAKLLKTMRDTQDADLAYIPSTFYQDVSFFLPWEFHLFHKVNCNGYETLCTELHIKGMNAMVDNMVWGKASQNGWYLRPCDCLTCRCEMEHAKPEDYVGFKVLQLDLDGRGLKDAVEALQQWADAHAIGDDAGTRLVYALSSGERVLGKLQFSMRDSAGQFGCSFATRNLGVCQLPVCTDAFCHVKMKVLTPAGDEEILDVPWTVVYHPEGEGAYDSAGEVDCTGPPSTANVQCMAEAVTQRHTYGDAEHFSGEAGPPCSDGQLVRGGREGRRHPVYAPSPSFTYGQVKECHAPTTKLLYDGMQKLGTSERHAAGMVMFDSESQAKTGVLALRSFKDEELALHNVFQEIAATKPDALLLDLRGNVGGDLCHVFELAYLLSSAFSSVQEAQEMLALHLRHSETLTNLVNTDINLGLNRGATTGWSEACELELKDEGYPCTSFSTSLDWYYCGDICNQKECAPCPNLAADNQDEWTLPFRPRCSKASLLSFDPLSQCSATTTGSNLLRTKKICPSCVGPDCEKQGKCGYDKLGLHILTDGRCVGACAIFVQLMEAADLATVVGPLVSKSGAPYLPAGALSSTVKNWFCALNENEGTEATSNPVLMGSPLPLLGQDLMFPLAAVKLAADTSKVWGGDRKMRQFAVTEKGLGCETELYQEALAAARVCGINTQEDLNVFLQHGGAQNCSLPDAEEALSTCNSTCSRPEALCAQAAEASAAEAVLCQPRCWSLCSAIKCRAGAERIWDGSRYLCWAFLDNATTLGHDFKMGQTVGQMSGYAAAYDKYSWRAKLSPGGATALILFLMLLAAAVGRLSHGVGEVSMPTLDGGTFKEGSPAMEKMKEGLSTAGAVVVGVGAALVALPVAAYHAVASRVQQYGGAAGGVTDTVHLPSSTEASGAGASQETSDYHAL